MNNRIKAAIETINSMDKESKEELLERFLAISNTYWFLKDCLNEDNLEIEEALVDEYYDENAEDYLHNVLVYGFDLSYNEASKIMEEKSNDNFERW